MPDIGEGYGITSPPWASGPYKVDHYTPGAGGEMVLVRNEGWKQESDPVRGAYPDKWVVSFGNDPQLIDQRLQNPSGNDETAIQYGMFMGFSSLGALIQLGMVYALVENYHVDYPPALILGVATAAVGNFLLNKKWTFKEKIWS